MSTLAIIGCTSVSAFPARLAGFPADQRGQFGLLFAQQLGKAARHGSAGVQPGVAPISKGDAGGGHGGVHLGGVGGAALPQRTLVHRVERGKRRASAGLPWPAKYWVISTSSGSIGVGAAQRHGAHAVAGAMASAASAWASSGSWPSASGAVCAR